MSESSLELPQQFLFSVITYTGPQDSLEIELTGNMVKGYIGYWPVERDPTKAEWCQFHEEIQKLKVWNWKPRYEFEGMVIDGTYWDLVIKWDSKSIKTGGNSKYPRNYKKLVAAVKTLCHIEEFE